MVMGFSSTTKLWIEKQSVLRAAEQQFRMEFARMLRQVRDRMLADGWLTRMDSGRPPDEIKIIRPGWPAGLCGIHYEAGLFEHPLERGILRLNLHVEEEVKDQAVVCSQLARLLKPYAGTIASSTKMNMPDQPIENILAGSMSLAELNMETLCSTIQSVMQTASFVDEALFLAGKTRAWRIDFGDGTSSLSPQSLKWYQPPAADIAGGDAGGQRIDRSGGRFNTGCVHIDGTRGNYGPVIDGLPSRNICTLGRISQDIPIGTRLYICCVVRATEGARLGFYGEGQTMKDGKMSWPTAFSNSHHIAGPEPLPLVVSPSPDWQVVTWETQLQKVDDDDSPTQGFMMYLATETANTDLRIDSIEFGMC
jgi:hypothetical protein